MFHLLRHGSKVVSCVCSFLAAAIELLLDASSAVSSAKVAVIVESEVITVRSSV